MANLDDLKKQLEGLKKDLKNLNGKDFIDIDTSSIENTRKGIEAINAQIKIAKQQAEDLKNPFQSINAQLRAITDEWKKNSNGVKRAIQSTDKIRTITQKIEDHQKGYNSLSSKDLENQKGKLKSFQDQISSSELEIRNLLTQNDLTEKNLYLDKAGNRLSDENIKKRAEELGLSKKQFESIQGILESNTENLSIHEDINNELDREIKKIKEIEDNLGVKTFSGLEDISKSIPGLRKFAAPFQDASKAAKDQAISNKMNFDNAKGISRNSLNALKTGKGLNAEKIKELGLQDKLGNLTGKAAANKAKSLGITKQATAAISPMKAGFKSLGGAIRGAFGPIGIALIAIQAIIKVVKFFVGAMNEASVASANLSKTLLVSREEARGIYDEVKRLTVATEGVYINATKYLETLGGINDQLGFQLDLVTGFGNRIKNNIQFSAILARQIGLSADAQTRLLLDAEATGVTSEEYTKSLLGRLQLQSIETGLQFDAKKTLEESTQISGNLRANYRGSTEALAQAVYQAKVLGFNLKDVEGISNNLLNFQSSIEAEMEAELLTGRQLNLEEARRFALMGETAKVAKELTDQGITYSKFTEFNVIQRQAIAKSLGMEVNQMADVLKKQEDNFNLQKAFQNLKVAGIKNELGVEIKSRKDLVEAAQKSAKAEAIIREQLGEQALASLKAQSAQEKFNDSLERAKDTFKKFVDGGTLDKLAESLQVLVEALVGGGPTGVEQAEKIEEKNNISISSSQIDKLEKLDEQIEDNTQSAFSIISDGVDKEMKLKKERLLKEQNEYLKFLSQQDEIITFSSLSEEARTKVNDMAISGNYSPSEIVQFEQQEIDLANIKSLDITNADKGDDFIIRPGQKPLKYRKDDVIIGGTNLDGGKGNGRTEQLLERLIMAVEQGQNISVDGNRLNTAVAMNTSKFGA